MKRFLLTSIGLFLILHAPQAFALGKCGGFDPCPACKSCATCKFCSKEGGTCGSCKNKEKDPSEKPKKEEPTPKPPQEGDAP